MRIPFDAGIGHYDDPPPGELTDLDGLQAADRFRFANELRAWIEVSDDGQITDCGYAGRGLIGSSLVKLGSLKYRFQAVQLADLQREPEHGDGWVRFSQTVGGRTGAPMPRAVSRKPFVLWLAPLVWTTLSLTLHADGRAEFAMTGASPFPRHWIYDAAGQLASKSGLTDFKDWIARQFDTQHSPWGDEDSPALVTAVETALERTLSVQLMHGGQKPRFTTLQAGRHTGPAGRARLGPVPGARRGHPGGPGRRAAGRVRAGRPARRALLPGRRDPHVHAGRGHRLPGRGGARRPVRRECAHRAGQRPPARGSGPGLRRADQSVRYPRIHPGAGP